MTDEELERLEKLASAATPGPWAPLPTGSKKWVSGPATEADWMFNRDADAAFIAAARDAVLALVAEVRRLSARRKAFVERSPVNCTRTCRSTPKR